MIKNAGGRSRVDIAVDEIIQHILKKNMQAGDRLPNEYDLARELGVGRSTLREAIKRLVSRNILEVKQGAGTFISAKNGVPEDPLGLTFIAEEGNIRLALELSDARMLVEPSVAALAALNATEEQIARMHEFCQEIKEAVDNGQDYTQSDAGLHRYIAECCGNSVLQNLVAIIGDAAGVSIEVTRDSHRDVAFREHMDIVQAIARRDSDGARYAMLSHLNTARAEFAQMLEEEL